MATKAKPTKSRGQRKHRGVRFSDAEWAELEAAAERHVMPSASAFIRQSSLRAARGETEKR